MGHGIIQRNSTNGSRGNKSAKHHSVRALRLCFLSHTEPEPARFLPMQLKSPEQNKKLESTSMPLLTTG